MLSAYAWNALSPEGSMSGAVRLSACDEAAGTMPAGVVTSSPWDCELPPVLSANACALASSIHATFNDAARSAETATKMVRFMMFLRG